MLTEIESIYCMEPRKQKKKNENLNKSRVIKNLIKDWRKTLMCQTSEDENAAQHPNDRSH